MDLGLGIAGLTCLALALGHGTIGLVWILPGLTEERLPGTPFGPPALSRGMLRFTWHVVTLMLLGFAVLLLALAWGPATDPRTLLLRWFAVLWLAATAMAVWQVRRRPRALLRFPVPFFFVVIAVLAWVAAP